MLLGLSPDLEPPVIVGGIVVFRLYYYIIPLFLAGALFAGTEVLLRSQGVMKFAADKRSVQAIGRWSQPDFVVAASAGAVALCGGLLMAIGLIDTGSTGPDLPDWMDWIMEGLDEFAPSLLGAALLVFAAGLTQRVKLAWRGSLFALLAGALYGVAYGAPIWVPGVLLMTACLLAPFPTAFYRNANLFTGKLRPGTALPLVGLILCVIALASFEPRLRELENNSFWEAILSPEIPRAIRASVAACVGLGLFALWRLLRPGRTVFSPWTPTTAAELRSLGGTPPHQADGVIWGESGRAAFAFRRIDGVLLAFGDPAGDPADRISAIWSLRDLARQEGLDPAIWRAGRTLLPVYGDIGLAALPLDPNGLPIGGAEDAPGPHATQFLVCQAERDLSALLPLLPGLARG
jgi:phosphatidylglycerol lysyltransferase